MAVFQANLGQPVLPWFPFSTFPEQNLWQPFLRAEPSVLPVTQPTVSKRWKKMKHWPKPVTWLHPFFICHQTDDGRGVAAFMPAVWDQCFHCTNQYMIAEDCPTEWKLRGIVMLAFNDCCSLYMNSCRSGHCPLLQGRLRWVHYWMNWMEWLLLLVHMVWWFAVCFWQSKFWLTSHLFNSLCDRNTDWLRTLSLAIIVYLHFVFNTWEQKIQAALFVLITFHFGWFAAVEKNRPRMNEMETNDALLELHFLERIILEMKTVVVWTVFVWIVRAVIFTI